MAAGSTGLLQSSAAWADPVRSRPAARELAWPSVSVIAIDSSIFPRTAQVTTPLAPTIQLRIGTAGAGDAASDRAIEAAAASEAADGLRGPRSRLPTDELARLWREWRIAHGKQRQYSSVAASGVEREDDEEAVRFDNFRRAVALADRQAQTFVDASPLAQPAAGRRHGSMYNGLADLSLAEFKRTYCDCSLAVPPHDRHRMRHAPPELLSAADVAAAPNAVRARRRRVRPAMQPNPPPPRPMRPA